MPNNKETILETKETLPKETSLDYIEEIPVAEIPNYLQGVLTRGSIQGERIIGAINVTTVGHIRGGQTAYNTGIGFFLGYSTDKYKFSIGNPSGSYMVFDGTNVIISDLKLPDVTAGTIPIASAPNEVWTTSTTYVRVKEIKMGVAGSVRIDIWLKSSTAEKLATVDVSKNGSSFMTATNNTAGYLNFNHSPLTVAVGDLLQVDIKATDPASAYVKDFRVSVKAPPLPMTFASLDSANLVT